jgi:hypothetical protein
MDSSLRIIVTGLIAQHPRVGGITWHYLQYLLGLKRLGHEVLYIEDSGEYPYNLDGGDSGDDWVAKDCSLNVNYLANILSRFNLENRWAYRFPLTSNWFGLTERQLKEVIETADLLINVSGTLEFPENYRRIPNLLYLDTDPMVTQIKIALGKANFIKRVEAHDTHFSFGERFSESVPETNYKWLPTRQPIVMSEWRSTISRRECFTTVMNWTSYEPLIHSGKTYGQKDVEFKRFLELPTIVAPIELEIALNRTEHIEWQAKDDNLPPQFAKLERKTWTPRDLITQAGWHVVDAIQVCGDLDSYRQYIQSSKAEWSVAKNVYVQGQPGWFSERSACYLASGRPVVVQDTGFAGALPVGEGIIPFKTLQDAADAIREIEAHYPRHADTALAIADEYFNSDKVLTRLIDEAMNEKDKQNTADQFA